MNAQERISQEIERRDLHLLQPETIAQVRRLCAHPETARLIFYERVLNGCTALDERETASRWQLFELIVNAWIVCDNAFHERRREHEAAFIARLHAEPALHESRGRLRALNHRSLEEHDRHESSGRQVPLPESNHDHRKPKLLLGKAK